MSRKSVVTRGAHAARSAEIALGIRAARALALVRLAQDGGRLEAHDRNELEILRQALLSAAAAAGREPTSPRPRGRRSIASVGLTLSTAARESAQTGSPGAAVALERLGESLKGVIEGEKLTDDGPLVSFLRALVGEADRATARSGETLVTGKS